MKESALHYLGEIICRIRKSIQQMPHSTSLFPYHVSRDLNSILGSSHTEVDSYNDTTGRGSRHNSPCEHTSTKSYEPPPPRKAQVWPRSPSVCSICSVSPSDPAACLLSIGSHGPFSQEPRRCPLAATPRP